MDNLRILKDLMPFIGGCCCFSHLSKWLFNRTNISSNNDRMKQKIVQNLVSSIHASFIILMCLMYFFNVMNIDSVFKTIKLISTSYYMHDLIQQYHAFINEGPTIVTISYLFHHIVGILLINYPIPQTLYECAIYSFWFAEISNVVTYIVYHMLHLPHKNDTIIMIAKIIQSVLFTAIRIFGGLYLIFYIFYKIPIYMTAIFVSLYVLNVVWCCNMWVILIRQLKMTENDKRKKPE